MNIEPATIVALLMAGVAFLTYRNSARKDTVTYLQAEVKRLYEQIEKNDQHWQAQLKEKARRIDALRKRLRSQAQHAADQDAVIMNQQVEIERLKKRDVSWSNWAFQMGRNFNQIQLEYGALMQQQHIGVSLEHKTGPLPPLDVDDHRTGTGIE